MANLKLLRKMKYYFYKYGIHKIVPVNGLSFLTNSAMASKWIAEHRNIAYTSFPNKTFDYETRLNLYQHVIDTEIQDTPIDYLEFGVAHGNSFKWWINHLSNPDTRFYGFDTFTGLPEAWGHFEKGAMSTGNEAPKIDDNRHKFYQGIFQDTLYKFLEDTKLDRRKVIHMDADLYSSTLFVLTILSPYLKKGDILLFDEFNVPRHEIKAFIEWTSSFYIDYTVLGEVNNYYQVAIKIN